MFLNDIPEICNALKSEKTVKIKILHKLIFNSESDRNNRNRLRKFEGFRFKNSDELETKVNDVEKSFSLNELITICNVLSIEIEGSHKEISERIVNCLNDLELLNESIMRENEDDLTENESDVVVRSKGPSLQCDNIDDNKKLESSSVTKENSFVDSDTRLAVKFSDIEGVVPTYNGQPHENVNHWIENFENIADMFSLSDLHKFIFAKRSLGDIALLLVRSETKLNSWNKLKNLLIDEFGTDCNSAQLHEMLTNRKIKEKESLQEYFLIMKELCSRGNIEDKALMQYIINGIDDLPQNKSVLYGCNTLSEFKNKLKVYDEIRSACKIKPKFNRLPESKNRIEKNVSSQIRCFNCGKLGHKSSLCKDKNKGFKCFKCNSFGHKAAECKSTTQIESSKKVVRELNTDEKCKQEMHKIIKIGNIFVDSLVDTGSQLTLIREHVYKNIGSPKLNSVKMKLTGFGNGSIETLGSFKGEIEIDDSVFSSDICVIDNKSTNLDAIIGVDIIKQGELKYDKTGVSLRKLDTEDFLLHISKHVDDINEIDVSHIIDKTCREEAFHLVENYTPTKIKSTDLKMKIILSDEIPVYQRPRRMSLTEEEIVSQQIQEWERDGIVRASCSDYASPIVLVKKKNGSIRLCVDYRKLNKKIIKDRFPLPLIDDVIDKLQNSKVYTTIDLKNGFFHVDVDENSVKYTSFITHDGQYEFLKVPFGLTTSPAVFSRYLSCVFRELLNDGTLILYMDDLIIPAKDDKEGIEKLKKVLQTASDYGLEINFKKCQFLQRKVEFLGHVFENGTISPSPSKVKAVLNFPEPKTIKQIQSFLGLTSYFRKFIPGYASIAKPLSDMLRGSVQFGFGLQQRESFNTLKQLLSKEPVLNIFVPGSELEVHTDASSYGYGAVLMQKSSDGKFHPVLYMSKKTSPREEKYSSYELEVLGVIEALKKFRIYLHGNKFKIITDCKAFQMTMDKKELTPKVARWALFLQDFDFDVVHRSGKQMKHVDSLSRYPVMVVTHDVITQRIAAAQAEDEFVNTIKKLVENKEVEDYQLKNNVLYKIENDRELIVVPSAMQTEIIKNAHQKGHFAVAKTEDLVKQDFYIPSLRKSVESVILNCVPCILADRKRGKGEGFLNPIPKENIPLSTYHIDFVGPLPSTNKNYQHIFTVVDAFTKFIWLYPVKSTSTSDALEKLELQQITFGNPARIVSDRGAAFTSKEFEKYCENENIDHIKITTGIPRGNGQIERMHKTLIPVLTKLSIEDPTKWFKYVSAVQRIMNSTVSRSTKYTPFELLTGVKIRNKDDIKIKDLLESEYEKNVMQERENVREDAKNNIQKIQDENEKNYNKKRKKPTVYKPGDMVAIQKTQFGTGMKLRPKFFGPYKVKSCKGHDRYEIQKIGSHEGPNLTTSAADHMKKWMTECH